MRRREKKMMLAKVMLVRARTKWMMIVTRWRRRPLRVKRTMRMREWGWMREPDVLA
jgi:hypothetical protein